ncbi:uncharacterized protein TNCV_1801701 [Trichonephila clavipes]|nr:uncharacterized protein TNCV_1801701 [Trichonephila clavipes]
MTVIDLKNIIIGSRDYEEEFGKAYLSVISEERVERGTEEKIARQHSIEELRWESEPFGELNYCCKNGVNKKCEKSLNGTWNGTEIRYFACQCRRRLYPVKITKRATVIPPLHGPGGMAYSDLEKAEPFKDTLEVTFQENIEPCFDDKIEVENVVSNYFENSTTLTPPLTFPI